MTVWAMRFTGKTGRCMLLNRAIIQPTVPVRTHPFFAFSFPEPMSTWEVANAERHSSLLEKRPGNSGIWVTSCQSTPFLCREATFILRATYWFLQMVEPMPPLIGKMGWSMIYRLMALLMETPLPFSYRGLMYM